MYFVIINEQYFPVRDELLDAVRSDLLDAVRHGGAFVSFGGEPQQQVEVLITPSTPVRIRPVDRSDQEVDSGVVSLSPRPDIPVTDVDWWLEWS